LLHTPWRIRTSMATAPLSLWRNALPGTPVTSLWRLSWTFGSSRVAGPAYQERPTRATWGRGVFFRSLEKEADPFPPVGSLTMGRKPRPPIPLIILSTGRDPFVISAALLSWGKLRGEPAIRQFDWSFAPIPASDERFARQLRCGLPPEFLPASSCAGIDHCLSGIWKHTPPRSRSRSGRAVLRPRRKRS